MMARVASLYKVKNADSANEIVQTSRRKYNEAKSRATDIAANLSQLFLASKALILPNLENPEKRAEFLAKFTLFKKLLESGDFLFEAKVEINCIENIFEAWENEEIIP